MKFPVDAPKSNQPFELDPLEIPVRMLARIWLSSC